MRLELVGNDRTGIVRDVTHVLADAGVNVEEFHTECTGAPNSGAQLFRAQASLRLPAELPLGSLQASLVTSGDNASSIVLLGAVAVEGTAPHTSAVEAAPTRKCAAAPGGASRTLMLQAATLT